MKRMKVHCISLSAFMLVGGLSAPGPAEAQDAKQPYASMAPIEQYRMDRDAEVALARTAAPASISKDAEVLVMGQKNYETAVEGKNGFVCLVGRAWLAPFGSPEFWNCARNRITITTRNATVQPCEATRSPLTSTEQACESMPHPEEKGKGEGCVRSFVEVS